MSLRAAACALAVCGSLGLLACGSSDPGKSSDNLTAADQCEVWVDADNNYCEDGADGAACRCADADIRAIGKHYKFGNDVLGKGFVALKDLTSKDPLISHFFLPIFANPAKALPFGLNLRDRIGSWLGIGQLGGGDRWLPMTYRGRPMDVVHQPLHISDADFDALVSDMAQAMTTGGMLPDDIVLLKAKLESQRQYIVDPATRSQ